ncbi:MAG TPA: hypothetical protein VJK02_02740, partial [Anaerolineales bacterium]|nr:hypothetical protein [Anaerolineales bacterium]
LSGRMKARLSVSPDSPIESRVRALESNFRSLDEVVDRVQEQVDEMGRHGKQTMAEEAHARQRDIDRVNEQLAIAETGGLTLSLIGLLWLAVGLIITTASPELGR